jgi:hypothetical protein
MPERERGCLFCNETGLVDGGFKIRNTCPKCHGFRVAKHQDKNPACAMCSKEPKPELEVTRA